MGAFAIISIVMTMAAAAASAKAQYEAGKQQKKNAEYNAAIKENQADEEQAVRAIESIEERNQSRRRLASMEARYAKSGVLMAGTPELYMQEQAEADEFNILTRDRASSIRTNNFMTEADLLRAQGEDAYKSGKSGAITSLLTGASGAAQTGYNYQSSVGDRVKGGSLTNKPKMMAASSKSSLYNNSNRMFS